MRNRTIVVNDLVVNRVAREWLSLKHLLPLCIFLIRRGDPLVGHSIEIVQLPRFQRQFQFQRVDCAVFGIDNALAIGIEIGPAPVLALDERLAIGVQKKMPLPIDLMQRRIVVSRTLLPQNPAIRQLFLKGKAILIINFSPPITDEPSAIDHPALAMMSPTKLLNQFACRLKFLESAVLNARNGSGDAFWRAVEVVFILAFKQSTAVPACSIPPDGECLEIGRT